MSRIENENISLIQLDIRNDHLQNAIFVAIKIEQRIDKLARNLIKFLYFVIVYLDAVFSFVIRVLRILDLNISFIRFI